MPVDPAGDITDTTTPANAPSARPNAGKPKSAKVMAAFKRYKIAAVCFNLSLLMRTLLGVGTPKQWMAGAHRLLKELIAYLRGRALQFFPLRSVQDLHPCFF